MGTARSFFSGFFCFLLFDVLVLLGLITTLNLTLLNPDFVTSEMKKLNVYSVIAERAKTLLPDQQFIDSETWDKALAELRPWFEQQSANVINGIWGYLKEDEALSVTISLEPVRSVAKKYAREAVLKSLPSQLQNISQNEIDAYVAAVYAEIDRTIPANFALNEASIGPQLLAQLQKIKQTVAFIQIVYKWLIGLAVLLVCLIALVHWWQPKPIIRSTGITFIFVGVACVLGSLLDILASQAFSELTIGAGVPSEIQTRLPQLVGDLVMPLRMYGLGFLTVGLAMIIILVVLHYSQDHPSRSYHA